MITNLLFTALCLGLVFVITLDSRAARRVQPVRVSRHDRDLRQGPAPRD